MLPSLLDWIRENVFDRFKQLYKADCSCGVDQDLRAILGRQPAQIVAPAQVNPGQQIPTTKKEWVDCMIEEVSRWYPSTSWNPVGSSCCGAAARRTVRSHTILILYVTGFTLLSGGVVRDWPQYQVLLQVRLSFPLRGQPEE